MWFWLSILALTMLVARRSSEKTVAKDINSMAMAWLQQAVALPVIFVTLFFAKFYWPTELPMQFWTTLLVYVFFLAIYQYCYFKALSLADISYVAPLLSLVAVGNVIGAYFVLGQKPTIYGLMGAILIVLGAYLVHRGKRKDVANHKSNRQALLLVLIIVIIMSYISNIEVTMLRLSNPTSYNFYSSILIVPIVFIISSLIVNKRKNKYKNYWPNLKTGVLKHMWPLVIVGVAYTINLLATYQAKLLAPNAGYVGAVKSAQVLPMVLIGVFFLAKKLYVNNGMGLL